MRSTRFVLVAVAVIALPGCLTPSMGRTAEKVMGGTPSRNPVSVTDVESSRLVGRNFDGTPADRLTDDEAPSAPIAQPRDQQARP